MRPSPSLLVSVLAGALAAGCSISAFELGERTTGETGTLAFEYTELSSCLFGCGLDKAVLLGSEVTITTTRLDPNKRYTARLATNAIGKISRQSESCSCTVTRGGESTSSSVEPTATCSNGATKECFHQLTIATSDAGEVKLEMLADGTLADRATVKVRDAKRIELAAKIQGDPIALEDGAYRVRIGTNVSIVAKAFDDGGELVSGKGGITLRSADSKVLKPQEYFLGAMAMATGEADLTVSASGVETVATFRIFE